MPNRVAAAALMAGLLGLCIAPGIASAQTIESTRPLASPDPPSSAASPYNARYIPGVGFRYYYPGGPQVYGYLSYGNGYRAKTRGCDFAIWYGEPCIRRDRMRWWW